jgi:hypothetical protein
MPAAQAQPATGVSGDSYGVSTGRFRRIEGGAPILIAGSASAAGDRR